MRNTNNISSVWVAALGVVAGALAVMTVNAYNENINPKSRKFSPWRKLELVLEKMDQNYVDSIDYEKVSEAAIQAALSTLDPHSLYMPPVELSASEESLQGNFDGIGIQFNVPNDTAVVLEVIPGGPSEKIGLQKGDRILKVDEKDIAGVSFPQDSMVRRMKGPAGSKVNITVQRGEEQIPFEITRGKIPVHCVDAAFMVNDSTGYVKLTKFSRSTYQEVTLAAIRLMGEGMTQMVLDLRDNTGGYLDQACLLSNMFLSKGDMIVYMEGQHRHKEVFKADGSGILKDLGLKVLINENSASSSEIVAGAIQDNDRGAIIGRRSFGKGLVQEPVYFNDGSGIRLTVARYHTPSGRCIQKPYTEDYHFDFYRRYTDGELTNADSIKVDKSLEYTTVSGRKVYGGGGIIPDVFVPLDTTRATRFYVATNKKATAMRFASAYFDKHREELTAIDDFKTLEAYLSTSSFEKEFLSFAAGKDKIRPASAKEWNETREYLMPTVRALVGRYSALGEEAFYRFYLDIDDTIKAAL